MHAVIVIIHFSLSPVRRDVEIDERAHVCIGRANMMNFIGCIQVTTSRARFSFSDVAGEERERENVIPLVQWLFEETVLSPCEWSRDSPSVKRQRSRRQSNRWREECARVTCCAFLRFLFINNRKNLFAFSSRLSYSFPPFCSLVCLCVCVCVCVSSFIFYY